MCFLFETKENEEHLWNLRISSVQYKYMYCTVV